MKSILAALVFGMMIMSGIAWGQDAQGNCTDTGGSSNRANNDQKNSDQNGDPISMTDGTFSISRTDLTLPGPRALTYTRCYSANNPLNGNGGLGVRWSDNLHKGLAFGEKGVSYMTGDGVSISLFYDRYAPGYPPGYGLIQNHAVSQQRPYYVGEIEGGYYVVSDKFGNKDYFELNFGSGLLIKSVDRHGNEFDYTYTTYSNGYRGNLIKVEDPLSGRYITFSYNSNNFISSVTDSTGRSVSYGYTPEPDGGFYCFLTSATSAATSAFPEGTTESYGYDAYYNLATITDPSGNTNISNTYGEEDARVTQQTVNGHSCSVAYDVLAVKLTFTDFKGNVTEYYSDGNRNQTKKIVHTSGLHSGVSSGTTYETDYTYGDGSSGTGPTPRSDGKHSPANNCYKTSETDPNGNGTRWTYDADGNILTATQFSPTGASVDSSKGTQSLTAVTTYTYESRFNQVASVTDPNGNVTTYDYGNATSNPAGDLLSITYPTTAAGTAVETFTYNSKGQVLTDTAPDGTVTKNTYDATTGYLTQTIKDYSTSAGHLNATTSFTYDSYGHVASVTDPNGHTTSTTTNALDQVTEIDGASGEVETRTYDANGNLTVDQKAAPDSQVEKMVNVYNSYEQLIATRKYTDATTYLETDYAYDANGNRTTVTDPLGHATTTAYDERDKPYIITDALGHATHYDFDANGNTIKLTDELSHATTYAFDGLNRMEQKTFPDSSYQTWKYDSMGNITGLRTTAGNLIGQTYDTRNRMLTQSYGSSTITNVYDILGQVLTSSEGGASLTYVYDRLGRNTSFTDQAGHVSTYTYDLAGNRASTTYPTGVTVKRAHDASNRVTTLKDGLDVTQATYSYDVLDRPTGLTLANSTSVAWNYDLLNRLSSVNNTLGGTTTRNYSYVYDNASRRTSETEPRGEVAYGYSDRNEVNSITEPSGSPFSDQSFAYDAGFNRSSWVNGSTTTSYTANNLNQYTAVASATPSWNSDGGLSSFAGNTYTYDALMRLTEVDNSLGKYLFSYDPMGRRVKKVIESTSGTVLSTYSYHYDSSEVAVEYQPTATWTYYLGLSIDQPVMRISGTSKQWYYANAQGSISAVADNSGDLVEAYEYDALGHFQMTDGSGTVITTSAIANSILYTGRNYDSETGNYFYRARYYSPNLGRFISRDPLSGAEFSQGSNLYAYCENDSNDHRDPTGMAPGNPIGLKQKGKTCVPTATAWVISHDTHNFITPEQVENEMVPGNDWTVTGVSNDHVDSDILKALKAADVAASTITPSDISSAVKDGPVLATIPSTSPGQDHEIAITAVNKDGSYEAYNPATGLDTVYPKDQIILSSPAPIATVAKP